MPGEWAEPGPRPQLRSWHSAAAREPAWGPSRGKGDTPHTRTHTWAHAHPRVHAGLVPTRRTAVRGLGGPAGGSRLCRMSSVSREQGCRGQIQALRDQVTFRTAWALPVAEGAGVVPELAGAGSSGWCLVVGPQPWGGHPCSHWPDRGEAAVRQPVLVPRPRVEGGQGDRQRQSHTHCPDAAPLCR